MGGSETMLADIMNTQCVRGDDVTFIIVNDHIEDSMLRSVDSRVRVIRLGRRPGSHSPLPFVRLNMLLRRMNPDIIHVHSVYLLPVLPGLGSKLVFTVHCLGQTDRWFGRCGALVAISDEVAAELAGKGWKATVIHNGIDTAAIAARSRQAPQPGETVRVINVGRLQDETKGQHVLIEAVALLRAQGRDVEATFIGEGSSEAELKRLTEEKGVARRVRFLGRQDRDYVYSHLRDYHLMCHPSLFEGFGLTVAEGMAAGLPVVVSDTGGPYEIIARGKYGRAFATGDAAGCASAIAATIDSYPTAQELDAARDHVRRLYSIDRMVDEYRHLYRRLHEGRLNS